MKPFLSYKDRFSNYRKPSRIDWSERASPEEAEEPVKYIIVCHGRKRGSPFKITRTDAGKNIKITFVVPNECGNLVMKDGKYLFTGVSLLGRKTDLNDICEGHFKPMDVFNSDDVVENIDFGGGHVEGHTFGIHRCYKEKPALVIPITNANHEMNPDYNTLGKCVTVIIRYHAESKYRNLPITIIPYTCSVSKDWVYGLESETPMHYVDVSIKSAAEELPELMGRLKMTRKPFVLPQPSRKRKRSDTPPRKSRKSRKSRKKKGLA